MISTIIIPKIQRLSREELEAFIKLKALPSPYGEHYRITWDGNCLRLPMGFKALVNGVPVRFEVDTGSTHDISIPPEVAIAAQIPIKQEEPEATAYGFIESYAGVIASLKIGQIEIQNVPVHVDGARVIWKLFGLIPIGRASLPLVGLPFLRHFPAVTLDLQQQEITFWNQTLDPDTPQLVPFSVVSDQIAVEAFISGRGPYKFTLDSGLPFALVVIVSEQLANELRVKKQITKITQIVDPRFRFSIKELQFGQVELKNISGVAVAKELPVSVLAQSFDGVLGIGLFKNQKVVIAFEQQRIYFESLKQ